VLAVVLLAGCGGSQLSSSELHNQATQICQSAHSRSNRIPAPRDPSGGAAFLRRGIAVLRPELRQLRGLQAPGASSSEYATALAAFSQKVQILETAAGNLDQGADPVATFKTLQQQLSPVRAQEDGAWRALGVPACTNQ
jgi:hypothetical protein